MWATLSPGNHKPVLYVGVSLIHLQVVPGTLGLRECCPSVPGKDTEGAGGKGGPHGHMGMSCPLAPLVPLWEAATCLSFD